MPIEPSLFSFIWKFSKADQIKLVGLTALLFPIQYLTLEIPKKIINEAIGSEAEIVDFYGFEVDQINLLALLCVAFLASVLGLGLLKMRLNTRKGVLAERMLRRFRFDLIARMMRFPQPYFQQTSQGELVSMVTAESEPLGGMMGDAVSLPIMQAGQMLTILFFLMVQSVWFGLAATAMIPIQAWLIPKMQRRINLLNRDRVKAVRRFATAIGESASGAVELRKNGGIRYWQAVVSDRLARLFLIRFEIYQKKFFMKFVNNLITQLTPLMFYAFGGYLVIQGELTLGALVAALSAHKDLASPWNELLSYYNSIQEASLRYLTITERFVPDGMIDEGTFTGHPDPSPALSGDIHFQNVSVRREDGETILKHITLDIPKGTTVGFGVENEEARRALADLFTRELTPSIGQITVAGHDISALHQTTIANGIGHASSRPFVLQGTFGDNVMIPLKTMPDNADATWFDPKYKLDMRHEATWAGNSPDPIDAIWVHPPSAKLNNHDEVREWWLDLTEALDTHGAIFEKGLEQKIDSASFPELTEQIVGLRKDMAAKLLTAASEGVFYPFDPEAYNPALPIVANLFFAMPKGTITQADLVEKHDFPGLLRKLNLEEDMLSLSRDVIEMLIQTFGRDGVDHPLFQRLGLDPDVYEQCVTLVQNTGKSLAKDLAKEDVAALLAVPFQVSAEQIGSAFSDELQKRIVSLRGSAADLLKEGVGELFTPLDPNDYTSGMTVLDNILFGKIAEAAGPRGERIKKELAQTARRGGFARSIMGLIYDLPTDLNGGNLTAMISEALDVTRAAIRRPDVLILEQSLGSYDEKARYAAHQKLRELLPEITIIYLRNKIDEADELDAYYEISHSQIVRPDMPDLSPEDNAVSADLTRKLTLLQRTDLFSGLDRKQLRLLAFGARWYNAPAGTLVFSMGDAATDGAYLIAEGEAEMFKPGDDAAGDTVLAKAVKGTLVGELGLIRNEPRALSMRATTNLKALRLGTETFLSVVEHDAATAYKVLQVVAGYVAHAPE